MDSLSRCSRSCWPRRASISRVPPCCSRGSSDLEDTAVNGKVTEISVDYTAQTWTRREFPAAGGCEDIRTICDVRIFSQ
jgi:hypothetical protein